MKDEKLYLRHILDAIIRIEKTAGMPKEGFLTDEDAQDATIRRLQIIGEATKKLPDSVTEAQKDIPWKRIAGMRDVLVHDYATVDLEVVWKVIHGEIPLLKHVVEHLLTD